MTLARHGLFGSLLAVLVLAVATGCSDDVVSGSSADCPDGETYNPIEEQCVVDDTADGPGGNTDPGGNSDPDGGDDSNGDDTSGGDDNGEGDDTVDECGLGAIDGQSCRPDGAILAGADLTLNGVDCEDGQPFEMTTTADQDGLYHFDDVPAGTHELTIESGSFVNTQPVAVNKGQTTDLVSDAAKICVGGTQVPIAILEGSYDNVGSLLDNMEIDYDVVGSDGGVSFDDLMDFDDLLGGDDDAVEFLGDLDAMLDYDILFIECGTLWDQLGQDDFDFGDFFGGGGSSVDIDDIKDNIRDYVEAGNSLYVSDMAQPFVQKAIPEAAEFYQESSGIDGPRVGSSQDVTADVISTEMENLLGADTTDISYNLGGWAVVDNPGVDTTVHFQSDVEVSEDDMVADSPLMISHEAAGGGAVIYTSFHNSAQLTGDMEEILEYMIFQL